MTEKANHKISRAPLFASGREVCSHLDIQLATSLQELLYSLSYLPRPSTQKRMELCAGSSQKVLGYMCREYEHSGVGGAWECMERSSRDVEQYSE